MTLSTGSGAAVESSGSVVHLPDQGQGQGQGTGAQGSSHRTEAPSFDQPILSNPVTRSVTVKHSNGLPTRLQRSTRTGDRETNDRRQVRQRTSSLGPGSNPRPPTAPQHGPRLHRMAAPSTARHTTYTRPATPVESFGQHRVSPFSSSSLTGIIRPRRLLLLLHRHRHRRPRLHHRHCRLRRRRRRRLPRTRPLAPALPLSPPRVGITERSLASIGRPQPLAPT